MKQEEWKKAINGFKISHRRYPIFSTKVENKNPPFHSLEEEVVLPNYSCCGYKNSAKMRQPLSSPLQQRPNNVPENNDLF